MLEVLPGQTEAYLNADPFPHAVIDNLLPQKMADDWLMKYPDLVKEGKCLGTNPVKRQVHKYASVGYPPGYEFYFDMFSSPEMVSYLSKLTGVDPLYADHPQYLGAGLHEITRGGRLKIHTDFMRQKKTNQRRILSTLFFLNKDWDESWGGNLELWNSDLTKPVKSIAPIFNRFIVFECSRHSYHGHPSPLQCPPERTRKGMAFYYMTDPSPETAGKEALATVWQDQLHE